MSIDLITGIVVGWLLGVMTLIALVAFMVRTDERMDR